MGGIKMPTDQQLKQLLLDDQKELNRQLKENKEGSLEREDHRGTAYDNHPADMGTELYDREKDFALEEHADSKLNKVNKALEAIWEDVHYHQTDGYVDK